MSESQDISGLAAALSEKDRKARIDAVIALGKIDNAEVVEPLIKAMGDADFGVRAYAAEALGKTGDERALEPLLRALNDAFYHVRLDAATALGNLGDVRAIDALTATMMRHNTGFSVEDDRVHEAAKAALEKLQEGHT